MAKNISLLGADYPNVPAVQLPQTGGGLATFYDIKVVDNLNSDSSTDALSAKQGKVLRNMLVSKQVQLSLSSSYSSGWVDDFLSLPDVTTRALFTIYNASQAEWLNGMKRESDQKIVINTQTALQNQTIYISGIFI